MTHLEVWTDKTRSFHATPVHTRALVHVVAVDEHVRRLLTVWLRSAGIAARTYDHLGMFLGGISDKACASTPGCLVIDAQPTAIRGLEAKAILLPLAIRCPIVVVENPMCEQAMVAAIVSAIDADRRNRLIQTHQREICALFETLTPRERQVMALVVTGMLNKVVGADLGVSEITVKAHRGSVMRKMGARSLADLVRMADTIAACTDTVSEVARSARSVPVRIVAAADHRRG